MGVLIGILVVLVIVSMAWLFLRLTFYGDQRSRDRIRKEIGRRGGKLLEARWKPFGPDWLEAGMRIYAVRYRDRDGNEHKAYCRPMGSAVYFAGDRVVMYARRPTDENEDGKT
jgi:hypothetical protein